MECRLQSWVQACHRPVCVTGCPEAVCRSSQKGGAHMLMKCWDYVAAVRSAALWLQLRHSQRLCGILSHVKCYRESASFGAESRRLAGSHSRDDCSGRADVATVGIGHTWPGTNWLTLCCCSGRGLRPVIDGAEC